MMKITTAFSSLLLVLSGALPATEIDTSDPTTYNIRFDGAATHDALTGFGLTFADFDGDGAEDLLVAAPKADPLGRSNAGSIYLLYSDHPALSSFGVGGAIDLSDPTQYNLRIDGALASCGLGLGYQIDLADVTGDGVDDVITGTDAGHSGASCAGAVFVLSGAQLQAAPYDTGTGHVIDLADPASFVVRWDGLTALESLGYDIEHADFDGDGAADLVLAAPRADHNSDGAPFAGSLFLLYGSRIAAITGPGTVIPLDQPGNFDLRLDAPDFHLFMGWSNVAIGDFDGDGDSDLATSALDYTDYFASGEIWGTVFLFRDTLLASYASGTVVDLDDTTGWNVRIDAPFESWLGSDSVEFLDFDGSGGDDLLIGARTFPNGTAGAIFFLLDPHYSALAGTGNRVSLANAANWNLRFDAEVNDDDLGFGGVGSGDLDHDGRTDLILSAPESDPFGRIGAGSTYVITQEWLAGNLGPGRIIDLGSPSFDAIVYRGPDKGAGLGFGIHHGADLDGDGGDDLLLGASGADGVNGAGSGSLFGILQFPHDIVPDLAGPLFIASTATSITGDVLAPISVQPIANAAYRVDDAAPLAPWTACTADDGAFDSQSEGFACSVSGLSEGAHTVHLRATDAEGVLTPASRYPAISVTVDTVAPTGSAAVNPCIVRFNLPASDDFGVVEMLVSEDAGFAGAVWEPYLAEADYAFSTCSGPMTLYVRYRDASGNESPTYSEMVTLHGP